MKIFLLTIILSGTTLVNAHQNQLNQMNLKKYEYGDTLKLNQDEEVILKDSIKLKLRGFSHKHPYSNGPTKATAYILIRRNGISEEISLSVHGHLGKPEKSYDKIKWEEFEIELVEFSYDRSIKIIIRPKSLIKD